MASNNAPPDELAEHRRKLFIQELDPKTTRDTVKQYLAKYPGIRCNVPMNKYTPGENNRHAMLTFANEEDVNEVMSNRDHQIDGKRVIFHRSVPNPGVLRDTYGSPYLQVSTVGDRTVAQAVVEKYFSDYGQIGDIRPKGNERDVWIIKFDYYDSVDRILLDRPHKVNGVEVLLEKLHRFFNLEKTASNVRPGRSPTPSSHRKTDSTATKRSSSRKVEINEQTSSTVIPKNKYCVHFTNLPSDSTAEMLSRKFGCNIYDILMDPRNDSSSSMQCWLINVADETEVSKFIQKFHRQAIGGSTVECEQEEDELELCDKFRIGQCPKSGNDCDWEHVRCGANGSCGSSCPYGHESGVKPETIDVPRTNITYRIKITGFDEAVTPDSLKQLLGFTNMNCYVDSSQKRVGYVVKIKTRKYAKRLMTRWHDNNIGGQQLKCQLEVNPTTRDRSQSRGPRSDRPTRYPQSDTSSVRSSQEKPNQGDDDRAEPPVFDEREVGRDARLFSNAVRNITPNARQSRLRRASLSESIPNSAERKYRLPSDVPSDEWEITPSASGSEKVILIRGQADRKRLAAIKIYQDQFSRHFRRELGTLRDLKGVKDIVQLIEPDDVSNNLARRAVDQRDLWFIMQRAPGQSLREFMQRRRPDGLELREAIELTLTLCGIVHEMHRQNIAHQDLSPDSIMIEWDSTRAPISEAQLTLVSFSQAVNISNNVDVAVASSKQTWYQAPQATDKSWILTVDPSTVCAILLWLLTQVDPRHENDELPHQPRRDRLNQVMLNAIKTSKLTGSDRLTEKRLSMYLTDTFVRAFGYPDHHLWTISDLACRLHSIRELISPSDPKLDSPDAIFQALISIPFVPLIGASIPSDGRQAAFQKASKALSLAKESFVDGDQSPYEWSDGNCTWQESPHRSIDECRNDDVLTYHSFRKGNTIRYSIIISCWASLTEERRLITFAIGGCANGKMLRIPIGQFSTGQDYANDVRDSFKAELKTLLLAIYKEREIPE